MNLFDKCCAVLAFGFGVIFLALGAFGLFIGCRAWLTLPPIIGVLPAFVGWGIARSVYIAWRGSNKNSSNQATNEPTKDPAIAAVAAPSPAIAAPAPADSDKT